MPSVATTLKHRVPYTPLEIMPDKPALTCMRPKSGLRRYAVHLTPIGAAQRERPSKHQGSVSSSTSIRMWICECIFSLKPGAAANSSGLGISAPYTVYRNWSAANPRKPNTFLTKIGRKQFSLPVARRLIAALPHRPSMPHAETERGSVGMGD